MQRAQGHQGAHDAEHISHDSTKAQGPLQMAEGHSLPRACRHAVLPAAGPYTACPAMAQALRLQRLHGQRIVLFANISRNIFRSVMCILQADWSSLRHFEQLCTGSHDIADRCGH